MIERLQFISQESEGCTHLQSIATACEAGVKWVQLRIKNQPAEEVRRQAAEAKAICAGHGARLIINDYPEVAREVEAYGLHLGKEDMPLAEARKIVGSMAIGATANTLDDIRAHCRNGADYIGLGPFRFTSTKKKLSPLLGLQGYRQLLQQCREEGLAVPLIAIGGIELEDIEGILQAGVSGVAVSSLIAKAARPTEVVEKIYKKLQRTDLAHA